MTYSVKEQAEALLRNGSYEQAEALYSIITIADPSDEISWIRLGITRYFLNEWDKAESAFDIAIKLHNKDVLPLLWKIECLLKKNMKEEALTLFSKVQMKETTDKEIKIHIKQLEHILEV